MIIGDIHKQVEWGNKGRMVINPKFCSPFI